MQLENINNNKKVLYVVGPQGGIMKDNGMLHMKLLPFCLLVMALLRVFWVAFNCDVCGALFCLIDCGQEYHILFNLFLGGLSLLY